MKRYAVLNTSTCITNAQAERMALACGLQLCEHYAPNWDRIPPVVNFYEKAADVADNVDMVVYCQDYLDVPEALAFHTEDAKGRTVVYIGCKIILDNGGGIFDTGTSGVSVVSCMGHELLEASEDPDVDLWAEDSDGVEHARELADAVQGDTYPMPMPDGGPPAYLTNFLFPDYFDQNAPNGAQLDYMNKLRKPFETGVGGYQEIRHADGKTEQVFGEKGPAQWMRDAKAKGRTRADVRRSGGRKKQTLKVTLDDDTVP